MKQSAEIKSDYISEQLRSLPQIEVPKNLFNEIQRGLVEKSFVMKHKIMSFVSVAAVVMMAVLFFNQKQALDEKDLMIQELVKRTSQLEQLIALESPTASDPGSLITERIVNMELYLAKLDETIKQTKDKQELSKLMMAKVDVLNNLVILQRAINEKPDYQKLKPYII
jgi:hypothetical protein